MINTEEYDGPYMAADRYECYRCGRAVTDPATRVCPACSGRLRNCARPVE
ncbi:MAG: rubrerythrin-like domain-containing protein [Halobacteriota archaeon]